MKTQVWALFLLLLSSVPLLCATQTATPTQEQLFTPGTIQSKLLPEQMPASAPLHFDAYYGLPPCDFCRIHYEMDVANCSFWDLWCVINAMYQYQLCYDWLMASGDCVAGAPLPTLPELGIKQSSAAPVDKPAYSWPGFFFGLDTTRNRWASLRN